MRSFNRTNHRIRVPQVRCVGPDGTMLGIMSTGEAIRLALSYNQDLVEISPNADPPVCRIMDFGKFMYEESRKQKDARKRQHNLTVKEVKFHANVGDHDYQTKVKHIRGFLEDGHKVKVSLAFRGRENAHRELGFEVIKKVIKDTADISVVESQPRLIGRAIFGMLAFKAGGSVRSGDDKVGTIVQQRKPAPAPVAKPAVVPAAGQVQSPASAPVAKPAVAPAAGQVQPPASAPVAKPAVAPVAGQVQPPAQVPAVKAPEIAPQPAQKQGQV